MASLRARVSFFAPLRDGSEVFVGAGQEVDDTHEVVEGRRDLFDGTSDPAPTKRAKKATRAVPKPE